MALPVPCSQMAQTESHVMPVSGSQMDIPCPQVA